jgi:hypothetical protein
MTNIGDIGHWISENESLLSGIVALVVLVGLIVSPIGNPPSRRLQRAPP